VRGLQAEATACGVRLRAALIVGPVGPLWTFHVAWLVQEPEGVRVNSLVMPHARITGKATGLIGSVEASPDPDTKDLLTRVNRVLGAASTDTYPVGQKADPT